MDFKALIQNDINDVFHNEKEFSEPTRLKYEGETYILPTILDHAGQKDRKIPSSDHADGIFIVDLLIYVAKSDLPFSPRKGRNIEVGEEWDLYNIVKVEEELGEILIYLEMMDE